MAPLDEETIKKEMNKELDNPPKEDKDKSFLGDTLDAADRRLQKNKGGSLAIIAGFLITLIASSALSWFQEQRIITEEGIIIILLMFSAWLGFKTVYLVYNFFALRLQAKAVEVDKAEIINQREQEQIKLDTIREERKIAREDTAFIRQQNRKDRKLIQDMEIRVPFMERVQEEALSLFKREDLKSIIEVSPSFVDTVRRLDDVLMKEANTTIITESLTKKMDEICETNNNLVKQVRENAEILNQVIQQYAEIEVKNRAMEMRIEQIQNEVRSTGSCIDNLVEILKGRMPKDHPDLKIFEEINSDDPPPPPIKHTKPGPIFENISKRDADELYISDAINKFPPPKKEKKEETRLRPPPPVG